MKKPANHGLGDLIDDVMSVIKTYDHDPCNKCNAAIDGSDCTRCKCSVQFVDAIRHTLGKIRW